MTAQAPIATCPSPPRPERLDSNATHRCFGLDWALPMASPYFPPCAATRGCDVHVTFGNVPPLGADASYAGPLRQAARLRTRFVVPDIGAFLIEEGRQITIEPEVGASDTAIQLFLIGTASSLILHQRGWLPLHGSGVLTPKGAVLFIGHSGAGKSTTLAALLARGYPMICDDLAAIRLEADGSAWVEPGVQCSKLWADSAAALHVDTRVHPRVRPELQKFVVDRSQHLVSAPQRLHAVYQLGTHNRSDWSVEAIPLAKRFNVVLDHTWQKMTVKRMGLHASHFRLASTLATSTRVRRFRRPESNTFDFERLVRALEEDFLS